MARMVAFELRWFPHGGGPEEEIRSGFGMTVVEFFQQLQSHLHSNPPAPLRPKVVEQMKAVARRRLWLAGEH